MLVSNLIAKGQFLSKPFKLKRKHVVSVWQLFTHLSSLITTLIPSTSSGLLNFFKYFPLFNRHYIRVINFDNIPPQKKANIPKSLVLSLADNIRKLGCSISGNGNLLQRKKACFFTDNSRIGDANFWGKKNIGLLW